MSKVKIDICYCSCHSGSGEKHVVACCTPCQYCGENVSFMNSHVNNCPGAKRATERRKKIQETYDNNLSEIVTLDDYQNFANNMSGHEFEKLSSESSQVSHELVFNLIGLCGETGEVAEKIKKAIRHSNLDEVANTLTDEKKKGIALELGDVLYYLSRVANMLGIKLSEIARLNQEKLLDRVSRDVVKGEGDNR